MTEEQNVCKCNNIKNLAKKVAVIALGTFIGVYAGLSLFAATHKPPKHPFPHMKRPPIEHRADFQRGPHPDMEKGQRPDYHRMKFKKNKPPFAREDLKKVDD